MNIAQLLTVLSTQGVELSVEGSRLRFNDRRGALTEQQRAMLASQREEVVTAVRQQAAASIRTSPLSYNQRALWFVSQEAPDTAAYNLAIATRIVSACDPATVREAFQGLTDRHPMLRTTYQLGDDGQPEQVTRGSIEVSFEVHDVPGISDAALQARLEADYRRAFDLERGPVFRGSFYTRTSTDQVLLMVVHHIAADAWSLGIIGEDFRLLQAEASGRDVETGSRPDRQYSDFVEWQEAMLAGPDGTRLADEWAFRLTPPIAQIDLPSDRPRPARKTFRGSTLSARVGTDPLAALRAVARTQSVTLYVLLLAAFDAMLYRLTGTEDLVVGTPMFGRTQAEFLRVVGYFVNPVPLRTAVRSGMTFRDLLGRVRQTVQEALGGQEYPLSLMVQRSHPVRDVSRSPLFETFFTMVSFGPMRRNGAHPGDATQDAGLECLPLPLPQLEGQFDLSLQLIEQEDSLELELRYSTDIFDVSTARGFVAHFTGLLESVVLNVDSPLEALETGGPAAAPESRDESALAFLAELASRDIRVTLEGDKLRLNAPAGALDDALKATLSRRKPEVIAALRAAKSARDPLRPISRTGPLPVSFAQQRLWFFDRMQPGTSHYNIALALRLRGAMDQRALTRALDALTQRHESLRTCIREEDGNPLVEIKQDVGTSVRFVDLSHLRPDAREREGGLLAVARAQEPFDLAHGPMARFLIVKLAADDCLLLICMHHVAADGWSLSVAAREITAVYEADIAGTPSPLAPLPIQYVDFAAWQREQLNSGLLARQLSYWRRELAGAPAVLELPTDRPRPPVQSFRGTRRQRRMPGELLDAVKTFSRANDATMYMTLLGAWMVLLYRYSGQEDIVVGSPMANRDQPELEGMIGCFVNNVVMRGRLEGHPTFAAFLAKVKETVLGAFDNRELPFERLVEALRPERSTSHTPIFQVLFTLHSFPIPKTTPGGVEVQPVDLADYAPGSSRFDLILDMDEHEGGLRMVYEYSTDLFDRDTIDRIHTQYLTLLRQIVNDAHQSVRDIPLLTAEDERLLLAQVNATDWEHNRSDCVHDLVQRMAALTPEAVAVEAPDATLTYAALEHRASQLAHLLRAEGVGRGTLVGVCLDRTSFLPVALLGVLKAGAAYVPVDPAHPAERLAYTLLDAQVACVVTEQRFAESVAAANVPLVFVDAERSFLSTQPTDAPEVDVAPADLAYVIYTSGSTGRPKGVEIEHGNLVNLLRGMQREPGIEAHDVLLAVTTPSFDIAGLEIFLPLVTGARTVIAGRGDVLDGERLRDLVESSGATIMQATPATWRLLIDTGWEGKQTLTALCGGEALPRDLARELASRVRVLWNMYGPTETTIWSTLHEVDEHDRDISIGHPIANTTVYVLDASGRPAPIGVAGELCIGGEGVARGYRARPELTAEKFVTVSLAGGPPERVYRTGDIVRLRGDLTLEFVGRRDQQVKLRGFRIELGEIESVLAEHASVRRSVVIVREDSPGDQRLVAYIVAAEAGELPGEALRTLLRARLPEYMVPSAIVSLPELPLTPNGKVDRKALPVPNTARASTTWAADMVMTDEQRRIAAIWSEVLRVERVGLYENFFDIGGHSLLVIKVHAALRREFGVDLTVVDLFQRTTIAAQAELLSQVADRSSGVQRAQARVTQQVIA